MEVQNVCGDLGSGNAQVYHILNTFITLESDFFLLESGHLCLLVAFGLVMAKQCKVKFIMCYQRRVWKASLESKEKKKKNSKVCSVYRK